MKISNSLLLLLLIVHLCLFSIHVISSSDHNSHLEGFDVEDDVIEEDIEPPPVITDIHNSVKLTDLTQSDQQQQQQQQQNPSPDPVTPQDPEPKSSTKTTSFEYWDEDEFEGIPQQQQEEEQITQTESIPASNQPLEDDLITKSATGLDSDSKLENAQIGNFPKKLSLYTVEIVCVTFLILFLINYFTGKKENENLALSWAAKFATKDSIFDKNFSLLGVGEGDDSPLLLKEGQNVFKFYASGRRYCTGLLATMELKSRHDLISRLYNFVVPCKDEISFEVSMNDDAMDHVIFAMAKKKAVKVMQKELPDLQRFAGMVSVPTGKKWVAEELAIVSESKEVAGDLITEVVLDQVFGDKAFEKFGKGFISMHFSDQHPGSHRKMLFFKFALPDANNMADMTRLVALVPYYIDLIGRYKLSSQARSKTSPAREKIAQEAYKELHYARQEALQRKKADRRKMIEEADTKLSAEALRKKEAKERAKKMKKAMPKIKMAR
ncbi:hypothetical protein ACFE04_024217 [Oxalis oulophora]